VFVELGVHGSRLSDEQLGFVGFLPPDAEREPTARAAAWVPAGASPRLLEQQQAELAALLDTMPGWHTLARRIVEE
jgi:hypothetical protein